MCWNVRRLNLFQEVGRDKVASYCNLHKVQWMEMDAVLLIVHVIISLTKRQLVATVISCSAATTNTRNSHIKEDISRSGCFIFLCCVYSSQFQIGLNQTFASDSKYDLSLVVENVSFIQMTTDPPDWISKSKPTFAFAFRHHFNSPLLWVWKTHSELLNLFE